MILKYEDTEKRVWEVPSHTRTVMDENSYNLYLRLSFPTFYFMEYPGRKLSERLRLMIRIGTRDFIPLYLQNVKSGGFVCLGYDDNKSAIKDPINFFWMTKSNGSSLVFPLPFNPPNGDQLELKRVADWGIWSKAVPNLGSYFDYERYKDYCGLGERLTLPPKKKQSFIASFFAPYLRKPS